MRLYFVRGDTKVARVISTLILTDLQCELMPIDEEEIQNIPEFRIISPFGKLPVLVTESTTLFKTNSILKHVARYRKEKGLLGLLLKEESQVDQWLEICESDLDPILSSIYEQMITGCPDQEVTEAYMKELRKILRVLEQRFKEGHHYLVGYGPTLADVAIASSLSIPFWPVFKDYVGPQFPFVTKWLNNCKQRFSFASVSD